MSSHKQSKSPKPMSLKQRFENIIKKGRRAYKAQHGNNRKPRAQTVLTNQQVWQYIQK